MTKKAFRYLSGFHLGSPLVLPKTGKFQNWPVLRAEVFDFLSKRSDLVSIEPPRPPGVRSPLGEPLFFKVSLSDTLIVPSGCLILSAIAIIFPSGCVIIDIDLLRDSDVTLLDESTDIFNSISKDMRATSAIIFLIHIYSQMMLFLSKRRDLYPKSLLQKNLNVRNRYERTCDDALGIIVDTSKDMTIFNPEDILLDDYVVTIENDRNKIDSCIVSYSASRCVTSSDGPYPDGMYCIIIGFNSFCTLLWFRTYMISFSEHVMGTYFDSSRAEQRNIRRNVNIMAVALRIFSAQSHALYISLSETHVKIILDWEKKTHQSNLSKSIDEYIQGVLSYGADLESQRRDRTAFKSTTVAILFGYVATIAIALDIYDFMYPTTKLWMYGRDSVDKYSYVAIWLVTFTIVTLVVYPKIVWSFKKLYNIFREFTRHRLGMFDDYLILWKY